MPAATTKSDLIAATEKEWQRLSKVLADVPASAAEVKLEEDTSIKDILTHRAHWIGLFFQWLDEGDAAAMPDHGVKWSELKPYNAGLRDRYAEVSWPDAQKQLALQHERLLAWMEASDAQAIYGAPMPGGNGKWTTGRYAEASGPSHYRSAAKAIRGYLRALSSS